MDVRPPIPGHLRELFPHGSDALLRLVLLAEENASLLRSDVYALKDWLEIAGYDHECLHVLLLLLVLAHEEGSLCLELSADNLTRRLRELLECAGPSQTSPEEEARLWAQRVLDEFAGHDFSKLIGTRPDDNRPVIQHVAGSRRFLYFQKLLRNELEFAQLFEARLAQPALARAPDSVLKEVFDVDPMYVGQEPLALDPDQRRAVELALCRPLALISGGPGTGKTSIVVSLLRCLLRVGLTPDRIALAAPTGRAAQRLTDAVRGGVQALRSAQVPDTLLPEVRTSTLHQLLDYTPNRDLFRRHVENPIEADVVIVDEVSMVGMVLMARLFQALRPQARVILLGDKDQLPSVDAGAVLANLVSEDASPQAQARRAVTVMLRTNHRSEPHVRAVAAAVNRQDLSVLATLPALEVPETSWSNLGGERGVRLLEQRHQTPGELKRILHHWADHAYLASGFKDVLTECMALEDDEDPCRLERLGELFRILDRTRLLTLIREGPWGCVAINKLLDDYLRPRLHRPSLGALFPGAPVLITRNDHGRQLFNGDVGLTLGSESGLRVVFPRQRSFYSVPADALPAHELGFALTVHKSQGSEYGQVLLVLPPTGGRRLLTKELVYTGITRARDLAILCATREVLALAVRKHCARESGVLNLTPPL
jgi:exodeoxyribonuclease V alpha subunit